MPEDAINLVDSEVQADFRQSQVAQAEIMEMPISPSRDLVIAKPSKAPRRVSVVKAQRLSSLHETVAVACALGGLMAGYFAWRLSVGTISVAVATPLVESALERIIGGDAKIGALRLGWDENRRDFVVTANDITATTDARTSPLALGQVNLKLNARALLAGRAQITNADLSGLQAVLVVDKLGRTAFGFGTPEEVLRLPLTKPKTRGLRALLDSVRKALLRDGESGRVEAIALRNATLIVIDADTAQRLTLNNARANVTTDANKIVTMQAAGFALEMGGFANVAVSASPDATQRLVLAANIDQAKLSKLPSSLRVGPLARFGSDTAPVSGKILVRFGDAPAAVNVQSDFVLGEGRFQGFDVKRASGKLYWDGASSNLNVTDLSANASEATINGASIELTGLKKGSRTFSFKANQLASSNPRFGNVSGTQVQGRGILGADFAPISGGLSGAALGFSRSDIGSLQASGVDFVLGAPNRRENNRVALGFKAQSLTGIVQGRPISGNGVDGSISGLRTGTGIAPNEVSLKAARLASTLTLSRTTQAFDAKGLTLRASQFGPRQGDLASTIVAAVSQLDLGAGQGSLLTGRASDVVFNGANLGTKSAQIQTNIGSFATNMSGRTYASANGKGIVLAATQVSASSANITDFLANELNVVIKGIGVGTVGLSAQGTINRDGFIAATIASENIQITHATQLTRPFWAQDLRVHGEFSPRRAALDEFSFRHRDVDLSGTATIELATKGSPRIDLAAEVDGSFSVETLLSAWPRRFLPDTRQSIARLVPAATAQVSKLRLAIPAGMKPKEILPKSGIDLAFDLSDLTVTYLRGMSPITNVSGSGVLTGNSLLINLPTGSINDIALTNGIVEIVEFKPRGAQVNINANVAGNVIDMAREIDLPPLAILTKAQLDPQRLSGLATVSLGLVIPLKPALMPDDIGVTVSGDFTQAGLTRVFAGLDATKGTGHLNVANNSIDISGKALFADNVFDFNWASATQQSGSPQSNLRASGDITIASLSALGLDLGAYATGPVGLTVKSNSEGSQFGAAVISADFFKTNITLPGDLWKKPEGVLATGSANLYPREGGGWNVQDLRFDSAGAKLRGALDLSDNAKLVDARFSRVVIDNAGDLAINVTPADTGLTVTLRGEYLNLSPFLKTKNVSEQAVDFFDRPLNLSADIQRVSTSADNTLTNVHADVLRDLQGWRTLAATGDSKAGSSQIRLMVERDGRRSISGILSDAGFFAQLLYPGAPIFGGSGVIEGELPVVGANSSGSLTFTGKDISLNRTGSSPILFDNVQMPMSVRGGVVTLRDGQADGNAYTVKASGYVDVGAGRLDVRGVATPGGLNRVLADIPLFGAILGGGADEGLLGVTFAAKGTLAAPRISLNPISALAPGFLRKLFESEAPLSPQPRLVVASIAGDPVITKWPYGPTEDMSEANGNIANGSPSGPIQ